MEREKILNELVSIIDAYKDDTGWTDLALIGKPLSLKGINYKAFGFLKLKEFIQNFEPEIEIKTDNSHQVPVLFARVATNEISKVKKSKKAISKSTYHIRSLLNWAWMGDYKQAIFDLKNIALKERWYYKIQNPKFPYPILAKYFTYI